MIEIQKLSKNFGKLQALQNVSLACQKGECIALIGPNGCGKTTLIKVFWVWSYPQVAIFFLIKKK